MRKTQITMCVVGAIVLPAAISPAVRASDRVVIAEEFTATW
jgi:hypothetical protein